MVRMSERNLRARANHLLSLYERAVGEPPSGRCLAIGAGTGYNVEAFGRGCESVHAIELEPREYPEVVDHGLVADGTRLPYPDDAFDLVLAVSVVEHVLPPENRPTLVAETARCLAPGGHAFYQIPNRRFVVELHTGLPFVQWVPGGTDLAARLGYGNLRDIHIPSLDRLVGWLEGAGLDVVGADRLVYPREAIPKYRDVYDALAALGVFRLMPFGFVAIGRA